jgi:tetratricopeptide (TPR) repeat protein
MKRPFAALAIALVQICALVCTVSAQAAPMSPWSLAVSPAVSIPLVTSSFSSSPAFSSAWGGDLTVARALGDTSPLALRLGIGYAYGGLASYEDVDVDGNLGEALLSAGIEADKALGPKLSLRAFLDGGIAYGTLSTSTHAFYGTLRPGVGASFNFNPALSARLDLAGLYKVGLYGGAGVMFGLGYRLPQRAEASLPAKPRLLELSSIGLKSVFPVLRSWYDQNPIGTVKVSNTGKEAATNIRVGFIVRQYMDAPKECATIDRLEPGEVREVPLFALFNDKILNVTEPTKVSGEVSVEYNVDVSQSRSATVLVNDRNALTWSDDRKAAAFVSSRDPWVLDLTGNFMATVKSMRNPELPKNFQTAIAVHEGLRIYGIGYMLSTIRPFEQEVLNPEAVDTLKFPRQTLSFRAGDCADLSVLYASCLEAAGVETAFITVPGHILMAIDLGIAEADAIARSMDARDLIVRDGKVWLPIETTMRDASFLEVWKKGAEEWRDASSKSLAAFYPMHEAWKIYAPMGLPADGSSVELPPSDKVGAAFFASLGKAVDAELASRIAALGSVPSSGNAAAVALNRRGVLYGKYGRLKQAEADFQAAAKAGNTSSLVNLGNVALLRPDAAGAYEYYRQAEKKVTASASLYINIARAASALGKADAASAALDTARKLDPKAADKYAELAQAGSSGTRAAQADAAGPEWF